MVREASRLIDQVVVAEELTFNATTESAWIDVIQKMDEVYADLVRYQIELEEKNQALEEAQQFIVGVLTSMTDVLVVCDIDGGIVQVNRALEELLGSGGESLIGEPIGRLFTSETQQMAEEMPIEFGSDSIVDCEVHLLGADGQAVPLAMNCSPRYDPNGRLLGKVMIGRPVGELRRAYEALNIAHMELKQTQQHLIHSEKMASLGRLVAGVAHELNNPISFVFGNMHALQRYAERVNAYLGEVEGKIDSELRTELRERYKIDRIQSDMGSLIEGSVEGAERIRDIVQELKRYSGGQRENKQQFDLRLLVQTAVQWVIKACRYKLAIDYQMDEVVEVEGRKGQVQQVLVNLIQNAVDVMEGMESPQIDLACHLLPGQVVISVRDHGPGIPSEELSKVFDPFYTTKPVGKGTGLGLYISYSLAHDMGGELKAANHPDGGACFTLTLPLEKHDE